ncbi:MAG: hypothetical protein ACRD4C_01920 [Candidatus Acidiferrales bacterium]
MRRPRILRSGYSVVAIAGLLIASVALAAGRPQLESAVDPNNNANRLAKEVVQRELNAQTDDRSLWRYQKVSQQEGVTKLLEVVETRKGEIHRLLGINGKPLTAKQRQAEDNRIQNLLADPEQFQQKQKDLRQDAEQERRLLRMLPDAFFFEKYATKGNLVGLRFTPNPNFHPSSREAEVFHHMEGTMWVDPQQKRLAELNGRLTTEVKFWHGVLGHLDEGGTFSVKQTDVGMGHWEMSLLDVRMDGKALFFKTIAVREKEIYSHFEPLPENTTLKNAVEILKMSASN